MHFLDPHPPYIFQADGQPQTSGVNEKQAYLDQIEYASTALTQLVTWLRAEDPTAIIIIEADEGMAYNGSEADSTRSMRPRTIPNGMAHYQRGTCLSTRRE